MYTVSFKTAKYVCLWCPFRQVFFFLKTQITEARTSSCFYEKSWTSHITESEWNEAWPGSRSSHSSYSWQSCCFLRVWGAPVCCSCRWLLVYINVYIYINGGYEVIGDCFCLEVCISLCLSKVTWCFVGWLGVLKKWSEDENVTLALLAQRALANLDRDWSADVFGDGVFLLYPLYRSKWVWILCSCCTHL